mmetsp:Transcript_17619/g.23757  ORF Transcript_17619/g.23757 Transcript_17619/m.23757 type:complete len:1111 (-) Transcript_17619:273-3605(-)|eukprot:CAMPEP_0185756170 /NCGR_PEP_ID=MMETSP1174-20130828/14602_1 /TAXON_ID=35687 /ORGANISM="Dictyocha speculum, Strain CCMP1381" /LENGTH=1110 /DNA_ID=CAMNT_0028435021 /DNA_START=30 /DNA_END=3362 /DNA_ORIENTATION=-
MSDDDFLASVGSTTVTRMGDYDTEADMDFVQLERKSTEADVDFIELGPGSTIRDHLRHDIDEALYEHSHVLRPKPPRPTNPFYRCVICTLPGGTCEHSDSWIQKKSEDLLGVEEKSMLFGQHDAVDAQLSDIVDIMAMTPVLPQSSNKTSPGMPALNHTPESLASSTMDLLPRKYESNEGASERPLVLEPLQSVQCRWCRPVAELKDTIGGTATQLSAPSELRAGHSLTHIGTNILVLFGGVVAPVEPGGTQSFPDQVHIYDVPISSWGLIEPSIHANARSATARLSEDAPDPPQGRYGHAAVAFGDKEGAGNEGSVWIFGGRLAGGRCSRELWILRWESPDWAWHLLGPRHEPITAPAAAVDSSRDILSWPEPRYNSASTLCKGGSFVAMHGGRDTTGRNFGDIWLWRVETSSWEKPLLVGVPISPRFSHSLVELPGAKGELLLLGGCTVSGVAAQGLSGYVVGDDPQAAAAARAESELMHDLASQRTAEAYALEMAETQALANGLRQVPRTGDFQHDWRTLIRKEAQAAETIAQREKASKEMEEELLALTAARDAERYWAQLQSLHDTHTVKGTKPGKLDGTVIDLNVMTYHPLEIRGPSPMARDGAVVAVVQGRVFLLGGQKPGAQMMDGGREMADDGNDTLSTIHVLETPLTSPHGLRSMKTGTWRWATLSAEDTAAWLDDTVAAADGAVRRAVRAVTETRSKALSMGHRRHGDGESSIAVQRAEATLRVHQWRARTVRAEQASLKECPKNRFSAGYTVVGEQIFLCGGWDKRCNAFSSDALISLDLASPEQRQRRMDEAFRVRLTRETAANLVHDKIVQRERQYKEQLFRAHERGREAHERAVMADEDMLSALPPLTTAPRPHLVKANATTLWISWDRVENDAKGRPMTDDPSVLYLLYMHSTFFNITAGTPVRILYVPKLDRTESSVTSLESGRKWFNGVVTALGPQSGLFDVKYEDGEREQNVSRNRIRPADDLDPQFRLIYKGPEPNYAVQGLVPDYVLENEKDTVITVKLLLETQGAEYGWVAKKVVKVPEHSLRSAVSVFETRRSVNFRGSSLTWKASGTQESTLTRKLKRAILLDTGVAMHIKADQEFQVDRGSSVHYL